MLDTFTLPSPLGGAPLIYGRDDTGAWFILIEGRPPRPLTDTPYTVTPLLDFPLEQVQAQVASLGGPDDFPYALAVEGSFRLNARHWLPRSLRWVEAAVRQGEAWPLPFLERYEAVARRPSKDEPFRAFQRTLLETLGGIRCALPPNLSPPG